MAQQGDYGQTLVVTFTQAGTAVDVSGATSLSFRFELKKARTTFARTPTYVTDGSDGQVTYTIQSGDWSDVDDVWIQAVAIGTGWEQKTRPAKLTDLFENITVS